MFTIEFDHFESLLNFIVMEDELQNESIFKISAKARVCDFGQSLKMIKTS